LRGKIVAYFEYFPEKTGLTRFLQFHSKKSRQPSVRVWFADSEIGNCSFVAWLSRTMKPELLFFWAVRRNKEMANVVFSFPLTHRTER